MLTYRNYLKLYNYVTASCDNILNEICECSVSLKVTKFLELYTYIYM